MQIVEKKLSEIRPYENNPRHNEAAVEYVANSLREFGWKQPIVIDKDGVIVAGHTRYKAALSLGWTKAPCLIADDLTDEQIRAYRLADNKTGEAAEWDFSALEAELDAIDMDMEQFGFEGGENEETEETGSEGSLVDDFLFPPFSVLDARSGLWRERKQKWKNLGIKSELGRDENLLKMSETVQKRGQSTSIFDPALCELMYRWFCPLGGSIYDPFAGGSVRGIVAERLGYKYTGIELRKEQVEANYINAAEIGASPIWHCDDSKNADKYIDDKSCDMIFSCPPYFDLEVYSKDERDLSQMQWDAFCDAYEEIIATACRKLKQNRFAVFVVGEVRDKKGFYRDFLGLTIRCFAQHGVNPYNELILLESLGSAAIRARPIFQSGRKVCKVHQNVLVFYKGDPKKIKEEFGDVRVGDVDLDEIDED